MCSASSSTRLIALRSASDSLTAQGATVISQFDSWTVLQDPEGNEFCVCDGGSSA